MWLDFLQLSNWQIREPNFTLDDVETGKLTIYNTLG